MSKTRYFDEAQSWISDHSHWDDHPEYLVEDWRKEVENNDTRIGYLEWILAQADARDCDADLAAYDTEGVDGGVADGSADHAD